MMARFYFDFHDADGILRDDDGEELASAMIARKVALESIGETVRDFTYRHDDGTGCDRGPRWRGACPPGLSRRRNDLLQRVKRLSSRQKFLNLVGDQFRVSHGVLDVPMAEIGLQALAYHGPCLPARTHRHDAACGDGP